MILLFCIYTSWSWLLDKKDDWGTVQALVPSTSPSFYCSNFDSISICVDYSGKLENVKFQPITWQIQTFAFLIYRISPQLDI